MIDPYAADRPNRRSPWVLVIFVLLVGSSAGMIGIHSNGELVEITLVVLISSVAAIGLYLYFSRLVRGP